MTNFFINRVTVGCPNLKYMNIHELLQTENDTVSQKFASQTFGDIFVTYIVLISWTSA